MTTITLAWAIYNEAVEEENEDEEVPDEEVNAKPVAEDENAIVFDDEPIDAPIHDEDTIVETVDEEKVVDTCNALKHAIDDECYGAQSEAYNL